MYELELFLEKEETIVASIQETELVPTDKLITFNGYAAVKKDREQQKEARGRGLLTLIRSEPKNQRVNCRIGWKDYWSTSLQWKGKQELQTCKPVYATDKLTNPHGN